MTTESAFLCYVHADDEHDQGRVSQLARDIANEFASITIDDLNLVIDHEILVLGQDWRERLDAAIRGATFMICVISPRFFASVECRSEVERFSAAAAQLGRSELLLPVYYIDVADLDSNTADPIRVLINRAQREDWRNLRFRERGTEDYRRGVHRIATALLRRRDELRDPAPKPAVTPPTGPISSGSIDDLSARLNDFNRAQHEMVEAVGEVLRRYDGDPTLASRIATTLSQFADRFENGVAAYREALDRADAYAGALLHGRLDVPDDDLRNTALVIIDNYEETKQLDTALRTVVGTLGMMANQFGVLRPVANRLRTSFQSLADTTPTHAAWAEDARTLLDQLVEPDLDDGR